MAHDVCDDGHRCALCQKPCGQGVTENMNPAAIPAQATVGGQHGRLNGASSNRLTDRWPVPDENVGAGNRRPLIQDVICKSLGQSLPEAAGYLHGVLCDG